MKLKGRVAIVTAAGRGIGRGIALALAEEGADLIVNSYRTETTKALADELSIKGIKVLAIPGDITQPEKIVEVVNKAISTFGKIDILVNNAGGAPVNMKPGTGPLAEVVAGWDATYEQNLKATVLMCEAVIPHFISQKSGKIVNVASIAGRSSTPFIEDGHTVYSTMKAGIIRYTQLLADRLGHDGINANSLCPGFVYTDTNKGFFERLIATVPQYKGYSVQQLWSGIFDGKCPSIPAMVVPLRREQTVEDMARAVVFLVSDDAINITGQALNVDGGIVKS
ncbi:MAG: SDR family oxidoreductase [Dehalococcoidales bacterium]|nr:SDR family oxidoreductase [Dehalococcoidales bacterium]